MTIVLSGTDRRNVVAEFARNAMQIRQTCGDCGKIATRDRPAITGFLRGAASGPFVGGGDTRGQNLRRRKRKNPMRFLQPLRRIAFVSPGDRSDPAFLPSYDDVL
jgi:hypothetical protein